VLDVITNHDHPKDANNSAVRKPDGMVIPKEPIMLGCTKNHEHKMETKPRMTITRFSLPVNMNDPHARPAKNTTMRTNDGMATPEKPTTLGFTKRHKLKMDIKPGMSMTKLTIPFTKTDAHKRQPNTAGIRINGAITPKKLAMVGLNKNHKHKKETNPGMMVTGLKPVVGIMVAPPAPMPTYRYDESCL